MQTSSAETSCHRRVLHLPVSQRPIEVESCGHRTPDEHCPRHHAGKHVADRKDLHPKDPSHQGVVGSAPAEAYVFPNGLIEREVEVLLFIAQGKTNREIASELVLSQRTVQRHISNLYAKIDARNRVEATSFALAELAEFA